MAFQFGFDGDGCHQNDPRPAAATGLSERSKAHTVNVREHKLEALVGKTALFIAQNSTCIADGRTVAGGVNVIRA